MKPVAACVVFSHDRHWRISASSLSIARVMIDIGQIMSMPACGPPIPFAADPAKKHG